MAHFLDSADSAAPTLPLLPSDAALLADFIEALRLEEGLATNSLSAYRSDLLGLQRWLQQERTKTLPQAQRSDLQDYADQRYEATRTSTANRRLSAFKRFFRWLVRQNYLEHDPSILLRPAHQPLRGAPQSLTQEQVEALIQAPDTSTALGLRDRAMLEVLYASGLRVTELVSLPLASVDFTQGLLCVRGMAAQERLVPFGQEARQWLLRYLQDARPALLGALHTAHPTKGCPDLFVTQRGAAMSRVMFWMLIKKYTEALGITVPLSPKTLRHAFAMHLLQHGADLQVVQLLLGHQHMSSTTIYAHVVSARLKALHAEHHPRGKI